MCDGAAPVQDLRHFLALDYMLLLRYAFGVRTWCGRAGRDSRGTDRCDSVAHLGTRSQSPAAWWSPFPEWGLAHLSRPGAVPAARKMILLQVHLQTCFTLADWPGAANALPVRPAVSDVPRRTVHEKLTETRLLSR